MLTEIAQARAAGSVHEPAVVAVARAVLPGVPDSLLLVADTTDPTARELLECYAPPELRLASLTSDAFLVVALSRAMGLSLLATPEHQREPSVLDEIARTVREHPGRGFVVTVAGGGVFAQGVRLREDGMVVLSAAANHGGQPS